MNEHRKEEISQKEMVRWFEREEVERELVQDFPRLRFLKARRVNVEEEDFLGREGDKEKNKEEESNDEDMARDRHDSQNLQKMTEIFGIKRKM